MKLKAKREATTNTPSEFALRVPAMEKRNDNLLKQVHNVVVPSNTMQTYSLTQGDYIRKHTANHMEHKVSNFTPKFLALLKKSSPASRNPTDDEPPVEGGIDGDAETVAVGGEGSVASARAEGEGEGVEGAGVGAESVGDSGSDIARVLESLSSPPDGTSGDKAVFEPIALAYRELGIPLQITATGRQGASRTLLGRPLETFKKESDGIPKTIKKVKDAVYALSDMKSGLSGSFEKRVKSDLQKVTEVLKRIDPTFKSLKDEAKKAVPKSARSRASVGGAGAGAGAGAFEELPLPSASMGASGGGGSARALAKGLDDEGEWEEQRKGRGKKGKGRGKTLPL
jgi:hypothetical protein